MSRDLWRNILDGYLTLRRSYLVPVPNCKFQRKKKHLKTSIHEKKQRGDISHPNGTISSLFILCTMGLAFAEKKKVGENIYMNKKIYKNEALWCHTFTEKQIFFKSMLQKEQSWKGRDKITIWSPPLLLLLFFVVKDLPPLKNVMKCQDHCEISVKTRLHLSGFVQVLYCRGG